MQTLPPLPSLQSLRVLDAVVQRRSFSAAAQDLGLTHGAVSRQIHQLEADVGVVLFLRRGARMEPTDAALAIATRAGYALRSLADLLGRRVPQGAGQRLRLATTSPFARFWVAPRLSELLTLRGVQIVSIDAGPTPIPFEAGKIDAAIRYGRGTWAGARARLLGHEQTFPVASPAFARRLGNWDAAMIARAPLIANAFISWRSWLSAAGLPASTTLKVVLETKDTNVAIDAALAGVGVALGRMRLLSALIARGELVALSDLSFDDGYAYYLAWPADSRRESAIAALAEWLELEFERESRDLHL
ncbi:MAG: LysR substrate-binding domain-containing protein [Steroidobacteraceae bacterium]